MGWRNDQAATLYYVEALDEGNPENKVDYRDEVLQWKAPFTSAPSLLIKTKQRFAGIMWGMKLLRSPWINGDTRNTKTYLFNPSDVKQEPKVISDRNYQDIYGDPGILKQSKRIWNPSFSNRKQQLIFVRAGFTKKGISVYS
jgi:hypothetical protein